VDFNPNGDCMQPAEFVMVFDIRGLREEHYVYRNAAGEYCGTDPMFIRQDYLDHILGRPNH